ncbi:autotransporter outer membrane beta-barrel domain-containing protein [Archangium violaceum]|uniref:autotransporter outer membrane beta-barrel domain-containing protein n=1 Tax=Archangium violaceum TaxID=83451 RepID=UPI00193B1EA1|nr:autotransporter outer membrane beta-barrel domain-containing protein [Archangium violaceum]QRK12259.1 autotransporter outer membrane beta-barrel domain-containing protein [Archangium violaceum]
MSAVVGALTYLAVPVAHAEESSKVVVPTTKNPYISAVATLYKKARYEEAQSKLEKALEWKSNGTQEVLWLKLMQGVLQAELAQGNALESFKEALALNKEAQLPVQGSRRLRKLFEQARSTLGLPADKELLAQELDVRPVAPVAPGVSGPPPRRYGMSVGLRVEVDVLEVSMLLGARGEDEEDAPESGSTILPITPAVSLGYTREKLGGALTLLVQPSPGLRAEGQFHPLTLGWVRPYARLGATAFFREKDAQGVYTFLGGVSGRGALGADVQLNSRMFVFADVAYERFFIGGDRYRSQSVLFSVGVGLFP